MNKRIDAIVSELREMLSSLAPYAPWQIPNLVRVFMQYLAILSPLVLVKKYSLHCRDLIRLSLPLGKFISLSLASRSVCAYNRASTELSLDIESLILVLATRAS